MVPTSVFEEKLLCEDSGLEGCVGWSGRAKGSKRGHARAHTHKITQTQIDLIILVDPLGNFKSNGECGCFPCVQQCTTHRSHWTKRKKIRPCGSNHLLWTLQIPRAHIVNLHAYPTEDKWPLAEASKVKHLPSSESIFALLKPRDVTKVTQAQRHHRGSKRTVGNNSY